MKEGQTEDNEYEESPLSSPSFVGRGQDKQPMVINMSDEDQLTSVKSQTAGNMKSVQSLAETDSCVCARKSGDDGITHNQIGADDPGQIQIHPDDTEQNKSKLALATGSSSDNTIVKPIPLSGKKLKFLQERSEVKQHIKSRLSEEGFDCQFDFDRNTAQIIPDGEKDPDIAFKIISESIVEMDFEVGKNTVSQMASVPEYCQLLNSWKFINDAQLMVHVDENTGTLKLLGTSNVVHSVFEDLEGTRQDIMVVKESSREVINAPRGCLKYIKKYKQNDILRIECDGQANKVKINIQTEQDQPCVLITGIRGGMSLAHTQVEKMVEGITTDVFCIEGAEKINNREVIFSTIQEKYQCLIDSEPRRQFAASHGDSDMQVKKGNSDGKTPVMRRAPKTIVREGPRFSAQVVLGELASQQADVLVCSTHQNLNLKMGKVSSKLLKQAGNKIISECEQKYPCGIHLGEVAETGPGKMETCKAIYYGALPFSKGLSALSPDLCYKILVGFMYKCLFLATASDYRSIAFPALGTGFLEYPADVVAKLMSDCVKTFFQHNPFTSLKQVYFVVYSHDYDIIKQVFLAEQVIHTFDCPVITHLEQRDDLVEREVRIQIGKVMFQVLLGDIHRSTQKCADALLCLWNHDDLQDPSNHAVIKDASLQKLKWDTEVYHKLKKNKACLSPADHLPASTLIHSPFKKNTESDITEAIQEGLRVVSGKKKWGWPFSTSQEKINTVIIPVMPGDYLSMHPHQTADIMVNAVRRSASSILLLSVIVGDAEAFPQLVQKIKQQNKAISLPLTEELVDSYWRVNFTSKNLGQVTADNNREVVSGITLSVTSESKEKNNKAIEEIVHEIQPSGAHLFKI